MLFFSLAFSLQASATPFRGILPRIMAVTDNPDLLNSNVQLERNIKSLDATCAKDVMLNLRPWADGSWKLEWGLTARRYADSDFSRLRTWPERYDYVQKQPAKEMLKFKDATLRKDQIDKLSPAEKYDILVGDDDFTLTKAQWEESRKRYSHNDVAGWMGICDGAAAASALLPEPKHGVDVLSPSGEIIRFHVVDIKALASLLWSTYNSVVPLCGTRCDSKTQVRDEHGVATESSFFDVNPGAWHIAVLNFIAKKKQPFFMDRYAVEKVWNVPILGYKMRYINPRNGTIVKGLEDAIVPLSEMTGDRFRKYRASTAQWIVGIEMEVKFAFGLTNLRDKPIMAGIAQDSYKYDLEIDKDGVIVGGEWYTDIHPDFLWAMQPGYIPTSRGDWLIGVRAQWDGGKVPADWLGPAKVASQNNQPLEKIVRKLIELSNH